MRETEELQREALEIFKKISSLCEKHHLKYYLAAGTLLGAVRHGGFIPWDDDIDVDMPREDYKKLQKILHRECGHDLVFQEYQTDAHFPFPFTKVFLRNEITSQLHYPQLNRCGHAFVDIFPLSRCPSRQRASQVYFKGMELLTISMLAHVCPERESLCGYTSWYMLLLFHVLRRMPVRLIQGICTAVIFLFHMLSSGEYLCYTGGKYG